MSKVNTATQTPENFFAGEFPIATAVGTVATGKTVKKFEPVKFVSGKIEPVTKGADNAATTADLYGIAAVAAEASEEAVIYLTGEFFGNAIALPANVTLDVLTPAFRKLGIFLK